MYLVRAASMLFNFGTYPQAWTQLMVNSPGWPPAAYALACQFDFEPNILLASERQWPITRSANRTRRDTHLTLHQNPLPRLVDNQRSILLQTQLKSLMKHTHTHQPQPSATQDLNYMSVYLLACSRYEYECNTRSTTLTMCRTIYLIQNP